MTRNSPRRRWLQFSLRTLLVAVLIAACGLAWLRYRIDRAARQRRTIEAIERLGGSVLYDYQVVDGQYDPAATTWVPAWLLDQFGEDFFHGVRRVHLRFLLSPDWEQWDREQLTDRAMEKDPEAVVKLAELKMRSCGGEEVRALLERALELDPKHVRANLNLAAWLTYVRGDEEAAVPYLDTVTENASPDSFEWAHARKLRAGEDWTFEELERLLTEDCR